VDWYRTSLAIRARWLIDRAQLKELGLVIDEQRARLTEYQDRIIAESIEKRLPGEVELARVQGLHKRAEAIRVELRELIRRFPPGINSSSVILELQGGKIFRTGSIKEALNDASVSDAMVNKITVQLQVAEVRATMEISRDSNWLSLRVFPESEVESRDLFAAIRDWISKHRPGWWQLWWGQLIGLAWTAWLVLLTALLYFSMKGKYRQAADELLATGVSSDNQARAIETLLALEAGYEKAPPDPWLYPSVICAFLACVVFSIRPKTYVGIGKGEESVKFWRRWIRVVSIAVPALVFIALVWPVLGEWIRARMGE
jgi:hypothetical protein